MEMGFESAVPTVLAEHAHHPCADAKGTPIGTRQPLPGFVRDSAPLDASEHTSTPVLQRPNPPRPCFPAHRHLPSESAR